MVKTVILLILFGSSLSVCAEEKSDSLQYKNSISIDVIPFYHVLFDTRIQIRIGAEYERVLSKKSFISGYLDIGLYDKYNFIKYYDFFSQNQDMYFIQQKVSIAGFHL